jgi:DNA mismatch endonuclease (patch repair protein)
MSKIRSKWTKPEMKAHNLLKGNKIRHTMHPNLPGKPDVFLKDQKTAIFIDGCFWHQCPKHGHIPQQNHAYWLNKLTKNARRDKENTEILELFGIGSVRLWECDVMSKEFKIGQIMRQLTDK